jgi:hypothetical protein
VDQNHRQITPDFGSTSLKLMIVGFGTVRDRGRESLTQMGTEDSANVKRMEHMRKSMLMCSPG